MSLAGILTGLLLLPTMAAADDIEDKLQQMQERMEQLEQKLDAQDEQLSAAQERVKEQERVIQEVALAEESSSGLSRFLEQTEFGGNIAASYTYNFNSPSSGTVACANNPADPVTPSCAAGFGSSGAGNTNSGLNSGTFGNAEAFHDNHNGFQVDQVYFEMMKPATAESRAGFGIDLVFGAAADALNAGTGSTSSTGDLSFLYQAYVSYLAPIAGGMLVQGGRFETIIGAEVLRADQNFNITRGAVYALQPTSHTGVLFSGDIAEGVSWATGIANDYLNTMADSDTGKVWMGQLGWSGETASLTANGLIGGDVANPFTAPGVNPVGRNSDRLYVVDVVATWDPSDNLAMWANFDYYWTEGEKLAGDNNYWGFAAASRLAITEKIAAALRGEFVKAPGQAVAGDITLWSLTGTVDYALTDNLKLRTEVRYDSGSIDGAEDTLYISGNNGVVPVFTKDDQVLALAQLLYTF
jgi:hypothetical protein